MTRFTITPRGAFSLREAALFGFGHRHETVFDGVLRLATVTDDHRGQVGVQVCQDADGTVRCESTGTADVRAQVARVLSLDHDGEAFAEVGRRDPVIGALQAVAPGLRPPQFHSPYEAAAWAIISARRSGRQSAGVRDRLARAHGTSFELAGVPVAALPTPEQLLRVTEFPGLPEPKLSRLHEVARAALDGRLDIGRLTAVEPEEAMAQLQRLPGIGPFYSALVVVRGCGLADVLTTSEPRVLELVRRLYGLAAVPDARQLTDLGQAWRPLRTWALVLVRAAGPRLLAAAA